MCAVVVSAAHQRIELTVVQPNPASVVQQLRRTARRQARDAHKPVHVLHLDRPVHGDVRQVSKPTVRLAVLTDVLDRHTVVHERVLDLRSCAPGDGDRRRGSDVRDVDAPRPFAHANGRHVVLHVLHLGRPLSTSHRDRTVCHRVGARSWAVGAELDGTQTAGRLERTGQRRAADGQLTNAAVHVCHSADAAGGSVCGVMYAKEAGFVQQYIGVDTRSPGDGEIATVEDAHGSVGRGCRAGQDAVRAVDDQPVVDRAGDGVVTEHVAVDCGDGGDEENQDGEKLKADHDQKLVETS